MDAIEPQALPTRKQPPAQCRGLFWFGQLGATAALYSVLPNSSIEQEQTLAVLVQVLHLLEERVLAHALIFDHHAEEVGRFTAETDDCFHVAAPARSRGLHCGGVALAGLADNADGDAGLNAGGKCALEREAGKLGIVAMLFS